jgi:hypothetical protein
MANKKSIIPEFMKDNLDDIYQFLFPLKIVLNEDQFGNSHYEVVVENINTNLNEIQLSKWYVGLLGKITNIS